MRNIIPKKSKHIAPVLNKIKQALNLHYKQKLEYIVLYGSYARGDYNQNSDIDILVVLNNMDTEMKELDALAEIKTDIILENGVYISTNPVSIEKMENSDFQFYQNIRKEGIII